MRSKPVIGWEYWTKSELLRSALSDPSSEREFLGTS
jgi:hypothetical protein